MNSNNITPFLPIYHRKPNKFLYYKKPMLFIDRVGNKALVIRAVYQDKSGNIQETDAQVIWLRSSLRS